jgi:hypothetical protein
LGDGHNGKGKSNSKQQILKQVQYDGRNGKSNGKQQILKWILKETLPRLSC